MTYLAAFDGDKSGWHIERGELLAALARDWTSIVPMRTSDEVRDVWWEFPGSEGPFQARAHKDGTCLYLDGDIQTSATFAVWYRGLIPPDIEVVFCNDEYTFAVSVDTETRVEDLVSAATQD